MDSGHYPSRHVPSRRCQQPMTCCATTAGRVACNSIHHHVDGGSTAMDHRHLNASPPQPPPLQAAWKTSSSCASTKTEFQRRRPFTNLVIVPLTRFTIVMLSSGKLKPQAEATGRESPRQRRMKWVPWSVFPTVTWRATGILCALSRSGRWRTGPPWGSKDQVRTEWPIIFRFSIDNYTTNRLGILLLKLSLLLS